MKITHQIELFKSFSLIYRPTFSVFLLITQKNYFGFKQLMGCYTQLAFQLYIEFTEPGRLRRLVPP